MGSGARNQVLQSLRGLAALMVLAGHVLLLVPPRPMTTAMSSLFQQNSAVIFFYVLSGYVLGESLRRDASFGAFVVKRLTRLLPVFWLAVFVGATISMLIWGPPIAGGSDWLNGSRQGSASSWEIIKNLLGYTVSMNGPLWSVQVELFMIPILPIMVYASDRMSWAWNVVAAAALCIASRYLISSLRDLGATQFLFLAYLNCFYLGITLPKLIDTRLQPFLTSGTVAIGALALSSYLFTQHGRLHLSTETKLVLDALISAQIVAWATAGKACTMRRLLQTSPLVSLGDWSYSFYCFATPIMLLMACYAMEIIWPSGFGNEGHLLVTLVAIGVLSLAVALPLSYLSFRFVESPTTAIGRRLARGPVTPALQNP
jgi:peptidoglycan/LPS O-acetylase OafA/YrhL